MALPPERISIKRRRLEDPVEFLYIHETAYQGSKRRFTDVNYKLLQNNTLVPASQKQTSQSRDQAPRRRSSLYDVRGVPIVRATVSPEGGSGEPAKIEGKIQSVTCSADVAKSVTESPVLRSTPTPVQGSRLPNFINARRFHITRDLSAFYKPHSPNGVRKPKSSIRPLLPTFIEEKLKHLDGIGTSSETELPVDRTLPTPNGDDVKHESLGAMAGPLHEGMVTPAPITAKPSQKAPRASARTGTSMYDDPSTWDYDSEQLAAELAAWALELDPSAAPPPAAATATQQPEHSLKSTDTDADVKSSIAEAPDEDFVFETYVRVMGADLDLENQPTSQSSTIGILVIDQEAEDLWQEYLDSDEESEWDEEDSNAEDNPANEYPEEEMSSDDEFARDPYRYRGTEWDDAEDHEDDEL